MSTILISENAARFMENLAADNSHGYDQANRWGPDYDCSSAVIMAWQQAGVPVKTYGASYTGNMYQVFLQCGFSDVTSQVNLATGAGLQRGDVLLNHTSHTAMFVGNGTIAHASLNENGGTTGGMPGDQTGREICLRSYYNYPWNVVLRYCYGKVEEPQDSGSQTPDEPEKELTCKATATLPVLQYGDKGIYVKILQQLLISKGFSCGWWGADSDFGKQTQIALHEYQKSKGLEADSVAGPQTWSAILSI